MKPTGLVITALSILCCQVGGASADDASPPKATATRPAKEHTEQISTPNVAPPATRTQTTGSDNQDPTTKQMNQEGQKKLETEGK
jgi:hypothetical protein